MLKKTKSISISSFVIFLLFVSKSFSLAQNSMAEKVANAYGFKNFAKVKSVAFTFNVKTKGKVISRSWYWEPGTNKVTYKGSDKNGQPMTYSYVTGSIDKKDTVRSFVDAKFINDQYWLLFPFHLIWDNKAEITDAGKRHYPINKNKEADCLIVKYPASAGGYTPGDIFELYIGKDNLIHEWIYRAGGKKDGRILTWEDYKNFNGLYISTVHNVADKTFKLWFSNIKVIDK